MLQKKAAPRIKAQGGHSSATNVRYISSFVLDFLYQLAQIGIGYVADFGLVVDGHQRNCNGLRSNSSRNVL